MSAELDTVAPIRATTPLSTGGTFTVDGFTCVVNAWSFSGTEEFEKRLPHHHFVSVRELHHGDHLVKHTSFDGQRRAARVLCEHDSFFLPRGQRWAGTCEGSATGRILECDLDDSAFAQVLGEYNRAFDLKPYFGGDPVAPGLLERLEALCLAPNAFPRGYAEALAAILTWELFRSFATKPFPQALNANVGASRFKLVRDHIEDTLESDTSLSELAALMGLSVSHFSHAFTAAYGVAPYRYILQRRIDKAKTLLRNSDATVAAISMRVGFSSQSRFTHIFVRHTGMTPSAYRTEQRR